MMKYLLAILMFSSILFSQATRNDPTLDLAGQPASRYDWRFTDANGSLGILGKAGRDLTVTLPCSVAAACVGLDTSDNKDAPYTVYISGEGVAEAALVTGGTCSVVATSSCTLKLTTEHDHPNNYTLGSATNGVQEAINAAAAKKGIGGGAVIELGPGTVGTTAGYNIYSTVFQKKAKSLLWGYGAVFHCYTRRPCHIIGDYAGSTGNQSTVMGLEYEPNINVDGALIKEVSAGSGTYTITTAADHSFQTGDYVILYYSTPTQTQEGRFKVTVTSPTQFQYSVGKRSFVAVRGYGWALLDNAPAEVIAQEVTMRDIKLKSGAGKGRFDVGIVNSIDQNFELDGYSNEGSGAVFQCTPNMCAPMFYARGDQGAAPVSYIRHADFSLQCNGNGVRNASANTLTVEDSVIQGYSQYGALYDGPGGGYQPWMVSGVYQESSACYNWFYPNTYSYATGAGKGLIASAGFITNGQIFDIVSDYPIDGISPSFNADNPSEAQQNNYYVIPFSTANNGYGPMMYIGRCLTTGKGNCYLAWPEIDLNKLGSVTWDVLVTVGPRTGPPYPGNAKSVAKDISGDCGPSGICTYVDAQKERADYTIKKAVFAPLYSFWPGAIVLGSTAKLYMNRCGQSSQIISSSYLPSVFCQQLVKAGGSPSVYTPYWGVANSGDPVGGGVIGARLEPAGPAGGVTESGKKGFENFLNPSNLGMTDLFTFVDSNPFETLATPGYQPAWDPTDTAFGTDSPSGTVPSAARFYERCAVSCSLYVGVLPNGNNWIERATASDKIFKVPITATEGVKIVPGPVEKLPACNSAMEGRHAAVTDSKVDAYGKPIIGGGDKHVPAYCNGTNWVVD